MMNLIPRTNIAVLIAATVLWTGFGAARAKDQFERQVVATTQTLSDEVDPSTPVPPEPPAAIAPVAPLAAPATPATPETPETPAGISDIVIQTVEPDGKTKPGKEVAWLGVGVDEASEALTDQLGLKHGEGLTITYIVSESPAAKADFHKNDVLVEFDGQMLVDPHQLRKLVQMHAEGDAIKLTFYRGGKKQTASVKLGKTHLEEAIEMDMSPAMGAMQINLKSLQRMKDDMRGMKESLMRAGLDKDKVNIEVKRTMEQTRKALQDAVREAASADRSLVSVDRELQDLARHGVDVDKDATVIVRTKKNSNRTMVETDDNGTYTIVKSGAKTHLTARDNHGKLLFEGDIDTPAEQKKVPKDVWEKAKSMYDQIATPSDDTPKSDDNPREKPNSRNNLPARVS